jgi:hypothetical protein
MQMGNTGHERLGLLLILAAILVEDCLNYSQLD